MKPDPSSAVMSPIPCSNSADLRPPLLRFFSVLALAANSTFGLIFQSAKVYDDKPVFLFIVSSLSPAGLPYSSRKRMERTPTPIRIPFNSIRDRSDRQRRETTIVVCLERKTLFPFYFHFPTSRDWFEFLVNLF